jgi:transposase
MTAKASITKTELLRSAKMWDGNPYFPANQVARWLGKTTFAEVMQGYDRRISFLKMNAYRFPDEQELHFDTIGLFLLTFHLRRRFPDHFRQACRILVDFLEYALEVEVPLDKKMKLFSHRLPVIETGEPVRKKLRAMERRLGISEGTAYRWRRLLRAGIPLEAGYVQGAQRRRAREFLPRAARILELRGAGLSTRQTAESLSLSIGTVRRVYQKADRLAREIATLPKAPETALE